MEEITPIGLDLAEHVFQVHGVDAEDKVIVRKQLRRCGSLRCLRSCLRVLSA